MSVKCQFPHLQRFFCEKGAVHTASFVHSQTKYVMNAASHLPRMRIVSKHTTDCVMLLLQSTHDYSTISGEYGDHYLDRFARRPYSIVQLGLVR